MLFRPALSFIRPTGSIQTTLTWMLVVVVFTLLAPAASAQSRDRDKDKDKDKDRKDGPSAQQLETRITKAEELLVQEYLAVANEFYSQDQKEQSIAVLERIARIHPRMEGIAQRIDGIREELLQENGFKTEVDVSKGWTPLFDVEAEKAFRVTITGDYKLDMTGTVPLTGLPTSDPQKDHVAGAPFGAVIGLIVTEGKPGEPFAVNAGLEHTPKKSGTFFVRVNVPAAAKCKGDLKVQASGAIRPAAKKK